MIDINGIIEKNKEYVAKHPELAQKGLTSHPTKKLAIVTCDGYAFSGDARRIFRI